MEDTRNNTIFDTLMETQKKSIVTSWFKKIQWRFSSFVGKQKIITSSINTILDALYSHYQEESIVRIGKQLLNSRINSTIPTKEDILWLNSILECLIEESCNSIIEIENYYILLSFLHNIPIQYTEALKEDVRALCTTYNKEYAESLLISAQELEQLLITTSLYYPEMKKEDILLAVCGTIRLSARFTELAHKDSKWESDLRKEMIQIHSLNIHLCIVLDDEELLYFLSETVDDSPEALILTIIQQITLEEVYRIYGEESIYFSKITLLLSTIPSVMYYGKHSPIFVLCNYIEYCTTNFTYFFALSSEAFSDVLEHIERNKIIRNFSEFSCVMMQVNSLSKIVLEDSSHKKSATKHTNALTEYTCSHSLHMESHIEEDTKQSVIEHLAHTTTTAKNTPTLFTYNSYKMLSTRNTIFTYLEDIKTGKNYPEPTLTTIEECEQYLAPYTDSSMYLHVRTLVYALHTSPYKTAIFTDALPSIIAQIHTKCSALFTIPTSILYAITTDIVSKEIDSEILLSVLFYCSTVISVITQEKSTTKIEEAIENEEIEKRVLAELTTKNEHLQPLNSKHPMYSMIIQ